MQSKGLIDIKRGLRTSRLPHLWCPGCGNGIITQAFLQAVHRLSVNPDKLVVVSGIGCSSRVVEYLDFDTVHTAHGRAIPLATGIKIAKPELDVVILAGDGDIAAIGGNHFIHGARRNIDLTVIIFNNFTYGMTGGQYSPLTPKGERTATSSMGTIEQPFDICDLAIGAGATYVARSTTWHVFDLIDLISGGIRHHGFSVIDVITGCHVNFGKRNQKDTGIKMLKWQKEHALAFETFSKLPEEKRRDLFPVGLLHTASRPEYTEEYTKIVHGQPQ